MCTTQVIFATTDFLTMLVQIFYSPNVHRQEEDKEVKLLTFRGTVKLIS